MSHSKYSSIARTCPLLTFCHSPQLTQRLGKRNTSRADFTTYERSLLRSHWGSQSTRLSRDAFLPFASCQLCLLPSRDPVACGHGHIFCRECALSNLLAQKKEHKRLEKEHERRRADEQEDAARTDAEVRESVVKRFEEVQMGLERKVGSGTTVVAREDGKVTVEREERGNKRKFEIDEEELLRIGKEERGRAKLALEQEVRTLFPIYNILC